MVPSTTRKIFSLAISLLVVVISLTGVALAATAPTVATLTSGPNGNGRYTPGLVGAPGKMARDAAGNFYVADFWGKGIVKLNRDLSKAGFIPTSGRPTAVAVLPDNRLVVAMSKPTVKVALYSQSGSSPNVTGEEVPSSTFTGPTMYNPTGIAIDDSVPTPYIYVVDSGDSSFSLTTNVGTVRVYNNAGLHQFAFGTRTTPDDTKADVLPSGPFYGGYFKQPAGITFEKKASQIVVADTGNGRLQFFNKYAAGTMTYDKSIGGTAGMTNNQAAINSPTRFFNPVDVAFEYDLAGLKYRMYVPERGKNEITVVDAEVAGFGNYLGPINGTILTGADMKLPSSILFEKTGTAVGVGVLYTANAAEATPANILALSIGGGTIPAPGASAIVMNAIPLTSTSPLAVSGTTNPAGSVTCKVNGTASGTVSGTATWSASGVNGLTLQPGMNYIVCQTTNASGVTAYAEAYTYSGTVGAAPVVAITSPGVGLYTKDAPLTVTGTTTPGNATVEIKNNAVIVATVQSDASGNWNAPVTLTDGSNLLSVTSWKTGTAVSSAVTRTVVADFIDPVLTFSSFLNNGSITNKAFQNLDGIITDANLLSIEVNGVPVPAKAQVTLTPTTTYFSTPVILNRGKNIVEVKMTDRVGRTTTTYRGITNSEITLKPEIPGITVTLPADNSYRTSTGTVTASGTADVAFNSVNAAGTVVTPSGTWTTASMSVLAGFVSYQFTASGAGVDTVTEKRTINTNAAYKQVAITTPPADKAQNTSTAVIAGTVPTTGETTPQISINGAGAVPVTSFTAGTGAFSHTVNPLVPGLNSIKIISSTGTTVVRNIVYDTTVPDLTLMADSKSMPTTVTGSIDPSATLTFVVKNGVTVVPIPASKLTFEPYDKSGSVIWHLDLQGYLYTTITFTATSPALTSSIPLDYKSGIPTGDVDGDGVVRLTDALAALRHVAGTETIVDPTKFFNADVGGLVQGHVARDGLIDITDSQLILNKAYGLVSF